MDRAVDAGSVRSGYKKVLLYGDNGRGKTSLACRFPKPLVLFSFEPSRCGGPQSVASVPGVKVLRYGTPEEVADGTAEFSTVVEAVAAAEDMRVNAARGYATVVVDGATGLQRRILEEILRDMGRLAPESLTFGSVPEGVYPIRSDKTKAALAPFLEIPAHVVVTAKEKDHNPPKEYNERGKLVVDMRPRQVRAMGRESWYGPEVSGSNASWLIDACGFAFRMYTAPEVVVTPATEVDGIPVPETQAETGNYEIRVWLKQHQNYAGRGCFPEPSLVPDSIGGDPDRLYAQLSELIGVE